MIARFRQVGGSAMASIPPVPIEQLDLKAGSTVFVEVERGRLVLSSAAIYARGPARDGSASSCDG